MPNLQKILTFFSLVFAFFLSFQTRLFLRPAEKIEFLNISLYASDIFLLAVFLLAVFYFKDKKILKLNPAFFTLAGADLLIFISIFKAPDKPLAIYSYLIFLAGILIFFVFTNLGKRAKEKIIYAFLIGSLVQAGLGIFQFFSQSSFAFKWLGLAVHSTGNLGTSVVEVAGGERWLRAYGGFDHPNILGGVMAVSTIITLLLYFQEKNKLKKIFLLAIMPIFTWALLVSFSRASFLAVLGGIFFLMVVNISEILIPLIRSSLVAPLIRSSLVAPLIRGVGGFKRFLNDPKPPIPPLSGGLLRRTLSRGLPLLVILSIILIFTSIYPNLILTRIQGQTRLEQKSTDERLEYSREALDIIKENPFLGVGVGNYSAFLVQKYPGKKIWQNQPVHNTFLLIASEVGIPALLLLLTAFGFWLKKIRRNSRRNFINILTLTITLSILALFDHWLWSLHFGWLFLMITLSSQKDLP